MSKFNCDKCDFHTNYQSLWTRHISTQLHKTGTKKTRSDKKCPDKCPHCDYTSTRNLNIVQHTLNTHATKEERKQKFKYYCEICDFGTFTKRFYDSHVKSQKHVNFTVFIKDKDKDKVIV